ncbi:TonB-dependent receptor [candidate division WOR-3 bacterium]|nr:TonB-dependent receptor [candidate division WOR-3 bacterium]
MNFLTLALTVLAAQAKPGSIAGQITDAGTGQRLYGVYVILRDQEMGASTDGNGIYKIEDIPPGEYAVEVSIIGYQTQVLTSVEVLPGRTVFLDFKLRQESIAVGGVTVRPQYFEKDPAVTVSDITLDYHEMRNHPEGYNVARTVASLPGVATGFDFSSDIVVRGGDPDENLTIIDNVPVPYPVHFPAIGGGMGQASIVNVEVLDKVEFSAGGYAARHGDKLSSLMDINLRDGNKDRLEALFDLNMSAMDVTVEGPIGHKINWIGGYRKSFLTLVDLVSDIGDVIPSYDDFYLRLAYTPNGNHKIWGFGIQTLDRMNVPPDAYTPEDTMTWQGYQTISGINWRARVGEIGYSTLTLGGTNLENKLLADDTLEGDLYFSYIPKETHLYLIESVKLAPSRIHEFQIGFQGGYSKTSYEYYQHEFTAIDGSIVETQGDTTQGDWFSGHTYAQYIFSPFRWLKLTPGLRVGYNTLNEQFDVEPRGGISIKPLLALASPRLKRIEASDDAEINLKWLTSTTLNFNFGIYNQLQEYDISINHPEIASKKAIHYIAGIEQLVSDDIKLSVEGYYKQLSNLLYYDDSAETYLSEETGEAYGLEFFAQKKMGKYLLGQASYSLAFSNRENPDDGSYPADWDIRHIITLIGGVKFLKHFEASVKYSYHSGQPWTPYDEENVRQNPANDLWIVERVAERNSGRLPAYSRLDLQLGHTSYTKGGIAITGFVNIQNTLDHVNVMSYGWNPEEGKLVPWENFRFMPVGGITVSF